MARPKLIKENTVCVIRKLYSDGKYTQQQLAKKFDLSQSTICKIVNKYIHKTNTNVVMGGIADIKHSVEFKYDN